MSSYMAKARDRKTGETVDVVCMDNYYNRYDYGYVVGEKVMTKSDFMEKYEFLRELEK